MSDLGNASVFSPTDASNNSATMPGWNGGFAPSTLDNAGRALQGAVARQWYWSNITATTTGSGGAYTATYSVSPAAYYTGQKFHVITNHTNAGAATFQVNSLGALAIKKVSGGALVDLAAGDITTPERAELEYNGSVFVLLNVPTRISIASTTEVLTGTDAAKSVTADALAALWEQGSDIASAGTISVGEGGYFNVTGTTTITDIDFATDKAGRTAWVKFAGALTLTHNATTLILPGGANITTAAGDTALFVSEGSDNVRCVAYTKASGLPTVSPSYWDFTSSDITAVGGGNTYSAVAHGLSTTPSTVSLIARCTTTEHGYSVGDLIEIPTTGSFDGTNSAGMTVAWNATNILVTQYHQSATHFARIGHASGGGAARNLTATSWVFTVRAKR